MHRYKILSGIKANAVLLAISVCLLGSEKAWGQAIPSNVSPGALLKQQEQTLPYPQNIQELSPEAPPETPIEGLKKLRPATQNVSQTKVFVRKIEIKDSHLLDMQVVNKLLAPYENKESTFGDIQHLADTLTEMYQKQGYVTSSVYIPPQKITDGLLILQAVEGKVGAIHIKPGKYSSPRFLGPRLDLDPGDIFNINTLKHNMLVINQNPDVQVYGSLTPGENKSETDLDFTLKDQWPFHVTPSYSNTGRRLIGDHQVGLTVQHNDLLGFGDKASTNINETSRSQGISTHYDFPIGSYGTTVGFDFIGNHFKLGDEFKALNVKGTSTVFSPSITQPLLMRERWSITSDLALDFKQIETDQHGSTLNRDQLRILREGLNFQEFDKRGNTFIRQELSEGLDLFGAGNIVQAGVPHSGGNPDFFRYVSTMNRVQILPWKTYGVFKFNTQLSPNHMLSSEEFQIGGAFSVRGYREGVYIGDKGLLTSAEWHVPFFFIPATWKLPFSKNVPLSQALEFVTFVDGGYVNVAHYINTAQHNEEALGVGEGLRLKLTRFIVIRLDLGFPILRDAPYGQKPRLHIGLDAPLF